MNTLNTIWRAYAKARTCAALERLSDRQLDDIDIHRGGIRHHVDSIYDS